MLAQPLTFRPRRQAADLETIIEEKSDALVRTLGDLAVEGSDGNLFETLRAIDAPIAGRAIEEIACLYLFIAQRSAMLFLGDEVLSPYHRDSFAARLFERTADRIAAASGEPEDFARFETLWHERSAAYDACSRMYRQENETLDDTVVFRFYQHVLALGREPALHVMASLQVTLVHVEISKTFGQMICEIMGIE